MRVSARSALLIAYAGNGQVARQSVYRRLPRRLLGERAPSVFPGRLRTLCTMSKSRAATPLPLSSARSSGERPAGSSAFKGH